MAHGERIASSEFLQVCGQLVLCGHCRTIEQDRDYTLLTLKRFRDFEAHEILGVIKKSLSVLPKLVATDNGE